MRKRVELKRIEEGHWKCSVNRDRAKEESKEIKKKFSKASRKWSGIPKDRKGRRRHGDHE